MIPEHLTERMEQEVSINVYIGVDLDVLLASRAEAQLEGPVKVLLSSLEAIGFEAWVQGA